MVNTITTMKKEKPIPLPVNNKSQQKQKTQQMHNNGTLHAS
jgi:hypothetical protein